MKGRLTSLGFGAFSCCQKLVSIKIPDSIELIDDSDNGKGATGEFDTCILLKNVIELLKEI